MEPGDLDRDLSAVLLELADAMPATGGGLAEYLAVLRQRACGVVDAEGGVVLAAPDGSLHVATASTHAQRLLQRAEIACEEGPSVQAYQTSQRVIVANLTTPGRWPRVARVLKHCGAGSVVALPLQWHAQTVGALTLVRREVEVPGAETLRAVSALAQMATIAVLHHRQVEDARREVEHLQTALHSRVAIEQAKGLLAEHGDLDLDGAFQALRAYCRTHNLKLDDAAARLRARELSCDEVLGAAVAESAQPEAVCNKGHPVLDENRMVRDWASETRQWAGELRHSCAEIRQKVRRLQAVNPAPAAVGSQRA